MCRIQIKYCIRVLVLILFFSSSILAQDNGQKVTLPSTYDTVRVKPIGGNRPKNVVIMIGDGMSLSHVANLWTANKGKVNLTRVRFKQLYREPHYQ